MRYRTLDVVRAPVAASPQILSHTGIRGVAALLVVLCHLVPSVNFTRRSYLMVDLFFVLSGFIISYVYSDLRGTVSFFRARFARIYPLHVFALLAQTVVAFGMIAQMMLAGLPYTPLTSRDLLNWILQLFLIQSWVPNYLAWNIQSWSISAEMFAYLLFPLLIFWRVRSPRTMSMAILGFSIAFYVYVAVAMADMNIVSGLAPFRCFAGFGLGMLVYFNRSRELSPRILSSIQLVALGAALCVLCWKISDPLIVPAFALLVWSTWTDQGLVSAFLSSRSLQWLGDISYSIYLLHLPVFLGFYFFVWAHLTRRFHIPAEHTLCIGLSLVLILCISSLTYKYIEGPARRYLSRRLEVRKVCLTDRVAIAH
jgi:peptidoglycan/LPS O-acetylase OafA/YrhL